MPTRLYLHGQYYNADLEFPLHIPLPSPPEPHHYLGHLRVVSYDDPVSSTLGAIEPINTHLNFDSTSRYDRRCLTALLGPELSRQVLRASKSAGLGLTIDVPDSDFARIVDKLEEDARIAPENGGQIAE
jgi:hypothetical protein